MPSSPAVESPAAGAVFRTRLHPVSCAGAAVLGLLLLSVTALIIGHNSLSPTSTAQVAGVGVALAVATVLGPIVRLGRSCVLLTGNRLLVRRSLLSRRPRAARLDEIDHVEVHSTWLGGAFDYGTLVLSSRDSRRAVLRHVSRAKALGSAIERQRANARPSRAARR